MSRSATTHRFGDGIAAHFALVAKITAPTLALLRPCPPYVDPEDLFEIGRLRWSHDRGRVEFRGNDLPLTADDVACIAHAIALCSSLTDFTRYAR